MMKALIIEDERMARQSLVRSIRKEFDDIEIIGEEGSVAGAVEFLSKHTPDIIFMDVELEDGNSFEIFKRIEISSAVIMTTAYDSYAIKAFEEGSIDYLLKPIDVDALHRAVDRCRKRVLSEDANAALASIAKAPVQYKDRFLISTGGGFVPVLCSEVAYCYSEDKGTYLMTREGIRYLINDSLDSLEKELNPADFFRISRNCIIGAESVLGATRLLNGRLKISASPEAPFEVTVSRSRTAEFLKWMK